MKHTRHTPGPWIAVGFWVEHPSDKRPDICNCDPRSMDQEGRSDAEILANARLIAAAPDLLDVVQAVADWNAQYPSSRIYSETSIRKIAAEMNAINDKARAAIANATGSRNV